MTRAQRRRAEREAKKGNKAVEQRITGAEESIRIALLKENIARDVDRKLYDKYYQKANKDAVDNIYSIILTSFGLALADTCPNWKAEAIAKRIQKTMESHQHRKIGCLEEIAYLNGWITKEDVLKVYEILKKNQYGQYLKDVLDGKYLDVLH